MSELWNEDDPFVGYVRRNHPHLCASKNSVWSLVVSVADQGVTAPPLCRGPLTVVALISSVQPLLRAISLEVSELQDLSPLLETADKLPQRWDSFRAALLDAGRQCERLRGQLGEGKLQSYNCPAIPVRPPASRRSRAKV